MCFPFDGLKSLPPSVNNLFRGIPFSHEDKYMSTFKSHYCWEGEQREFLLAVFACFCRFSKGVFCKNSPISMGRNGRIKPGKLLNLI